MSVDATIATWRLSRDQVTPAQKLILLSCANRADESSECPLSLSVIEKDTALNQHTIQGSIKALLDMNIISSVGDKKDQDNLPDAIKLTYLDGREV
jgi:DNA-binding MarR family transcriptional regulator